MALNIQRQLNSAREQSQVALGRLSTGLRINSASDDAASLAVASGLAVQRRIALQGSRNLNDGLSLLSVADSALESLTEIATRIQELATQASSGQFRTSQRAAIDREAQALAQEYSRITKSTEFNGRKLFDGSFDSLTLTFGASPYEQITSGLGGAIGTGTFTQMADISTGVNAIDSELADFNGDGILDLASASTAGQVQVFLGAGNGTFGAAITTNTPSINYLSTGDLNSDGKADLVYGYYLAGGDLYAQLSNGDGTFGAATSYATSGNVQGTQLADLDGNGTLDIVAVSSETNQISIFRGLGNGLFQAAQVLATPDTPYDAQIGDVTGDGAPEIFIPGSTSGTTSLYINNGSGTFSSGISLSNPGGGSGAAIGDFNNDGKADYLTIDYGAPTVRVSLGNGDGTFSSPIITSTSTVPYNGTAADFNGDGNLDVAVATLGGTLDLLLGRGNGTFSPTQTYLGLSSPRQASNGDINGDGVPDIVLPEFSGNSVAVFLANTTQGISALQPFSLKSVPEARSAAQYIRDVVDDRITQRGIIGAFMTRVGVALSHTQQRAQVLAEAHSRITDADVAAEAASLLAARIREQIAASILAQGNQIPALALRLIRN